MIAIGCDHGGFALKKEIIQYLNDNHIEFKDFGTDSEASVNYAPIAAAVGHSVANGECEKGILICGTGIGMCITANKFKGIRAALCYNEVAAELSRRHNNANILCLSGNFLSEATAEAIVRLWLVAPFDGERHQRRLDLIAKIEDETGL